MEVTTKKNIMVTVSIRTYREKLEQAKELNINISKTCRDALNKAIDIKTKENEAKESKQAVEMPF